MTAKDTAPPSRGAHRVRALQRPCPRKRAQETPGVSHTRSPACKVKKAHEQSHHRSGQIIRRFLRNGFNSFLRALPGDRAFLSPSPLRSLLLKNLTPASRRQDHTTSPSAGKARPSAAPPASIASRPTFVTMANAPPKGRDGSLYCCFYQAVKQNF